MHYIYWLLQLALQHTHIFQCWCIVWNMYLEKRKVICKLTSSEHSIYSKLTTISCLSGTQPRDLWPRQNTITHYSITRAVVSLDKVPLIWLARKWCYLTTFTSHKPQQSMLALMWPDALIAWLRPVRTYLAISKELIQIILNTTMQQSFWYHVKHAHRVSTRFNEHSDQDPWYGAGQGAGDACAWWIVQANSMIVAYNTSANPWCIACPNHSLQLHLGLDSFIDNTDLMAAMLPNQLATTLIQEVQYNLTLWHDLLKASGVALNPAKCIWFYFNWKQDAQGTVKITAPPKHTPPIQIHTAPNQLIPIWLLQLHEAHCYLRVLQFTTNENCKTKLSLFQQCNSKFIALPQQCPFPQCNIHIIYKQCYLPTISYPLPALTMPPAKFYKLQSQPHPYSSQKWVILKLSPELQPMQQETTVVLVSEI